MGFDPATYFDGTAFPVHVDHRASFLQPDGVVAVVDSVSALLTTHALRSMNGQVATSQTPREAAAGFLSGWTPPGGTPG
jgi:glycine betaine/choline ABC-type transport system substrate-binding protein